MEMQPLSFVRTRDNSPTLMGAYEPMHSMFGAFGETCHVYGAALELFQKRKLQGGTKVWSVGMGLGYCEMAIVSYLKTECEIISFEPDSTLCEQFTDWVFGKDCFEQFERAYCEIERRFSEKFSADNIRALLKHAMMKKQWRVFPNIESPPNEQCDLMLFDLYSSASNPKLWEAHFLQELFSTHCKVGSVVASYAAKSTLKRVLRETGFKLHPTRGFAGKREFTLAEKLR